MNNNTLGGLAALAEGIKQGVSSYRDERRYQDERKRQEKQDSLSNAMARAGLLDRGLVINEDDYSVSKTAEQLEKEKFERELKEREFLRKEEDRDLDQQYKQGLLGLRGQELGLRRQDISQRAVDRDLNRQATLQGRAAAREEKPLTQDEANAAKFYDLMMASKGTLDEIEGSGKFNPNSLTMLGGGLLNPLRSTQEQKYRNASDNWIRANLRKESGAAIGKDEMEGERSRYFPVYGDSPEVIKQKAALRGQAEIGIKRSAGRAFKGGMLGDQVSTQSSAPSRAVSPKQMTREEKLRELGLK